MFKIVFNKLTIKNFLSIGPKVEFDFSIHTGLNYVFGNDKDIPGVKNGIGKSLIFVDALLYILYGNNSKDISKKFIFNRQITKNDEMELTLSLSIGNKEYLIRAGINKPLTACTSFFEVSENGKLLPSKSSIDETRKYFINEYLKINYNIFKNSVILSSNDTQSFFSMDKSQKREFIESVFNLNHFGEILKKVRNESNKISKEILTLQTTIKQLNIDLDKFSLLDKNYITDKTSLINEITNNIRKLEVDKDKTTELLNYFISQKETIKTTDKIALLEKKKIVENKIEVILKFKLDKEHSIDKINSIISNNENIIKNICTTCKDKILDLLNIKNSDITISEYRSFIKQQENKFIETKNILNKIEHIIVENDTNYNKLNEYNNLIIKYNTNILDITEQINKLNKSKEDKIKEESPYLTLINEHNKLLENNNIDLNKFYKRKKYLDIIEHIVSEDGVKKFIINDLIDILNNKIKYYLTKTNALYTCMFDNNFNAEFITVTGPCTFNNFSTGEKARINICVLFAFKDMLVELSGINSSILIIDEFLDNGLCQYGVESIIDIIKTLIKENKQTVFLISHRDNLDENNFDNIIELEKKNGFTQIYKDIQGGINAAV